MEVCQKARERVDTYRLFSSHQDVSLLRFLVHWHGLGPDGMRGGYQVCKEERGGMVVRSARIEGLRSAEVWKMGYSVVEYICMYLMEHGSSFEMQPLWRAWNARQS
jgi:hypothetical protein